jgi:hypothetical protein
MPSSDTLMPNAIREYRNGIHQGVDFYAVHRSRTPGWLIALRAIVIHITTTVDIRPFVTGHRRIIAYSTVRKGINGNSMPGTRVDVLPEALCFWDYLAVETTKPY